MRISDGSSDVCSSDLLFPNVDLRRSEGELGIVSGSPDAVRDEPDRRGGALLEVDGLTTRFPVRGGLLGRPVGNIHAGENEIGRALWMASVWTTVWIWEGLGV